MGVFFSTSSLSNQINKTENESVTFWYTLLKALELSLLNLYDQPLIHMWRQRRLFWPVWSSSSHHVASLPQAMLWTLASPCCVKLQVSPSTMRKVSASLSLTRSSSRWRARTGLWATTETRRWRTRPCWRLSRFFDVTRFESCLESVDSDPQVRESEQTGLSFFPPV